MLMSTVLAAPKTTKKTLQKTVKNRDIVFEKICENYRILKFLWHFYDIFRSMAMKKTLPISKNKWWNSKKVYRIISMICMIITKWWFQWNRHQIRAKLLPMMSKDFLTQLILKHSTSIRLGYFLRKWEFQGSKSNIFRPFQFEIGHFFRIFIENDYKCPPLLFESDRKNYFLVFLGTFLGFFYRKWL